MKLYELKKGTKVEGGLIGFYGNIYKLSFLGIDGMYGRWEREDGEILIYGRGFDTLEDLELNIIK